MLRYALLLLALLISTPSATAQLVADTLFTWQGYARAASCRLQLYTNPADEKRPHTAILKELAGNEGPSTIADVRYLADEIGRAYGIDPAATNWVFHWGAFSFAGAEPDANKEIFIRATFTRSKSDNLTGPTWRVVAREEVTAYTDRHFQ